MRTEYECEQCCENVRVIHEDYHEFSVFGAVCSDCLRDITGDAPVDERAADAMPSTKGKL